MTKTSCLSTRPAISYGVTWHVAFGMCGIPIFITLPLNFFIPGANEQRSDSAPQRYFFIDQQDRCVDWESRLAGRFFWLVVEPTLWETSFRFPADGRNPTFFVCIKPCKQMSIYHTAAGFRTILEKITADSLGDPPTKKKQQTTETGP